MSDAPASIEGNGAPTQEAPANAPAQDSSWYSGFDQETVGWLENRGLTKVEPNEALKNLTTGFRNAEKYIGTPVDKLLRIPDFDKAERSELDQFYSKIGRPTDPKEYGLAVPEGQPREFADWAQGVFHEAGLSKRQSAIVAEKWNAYMAGAQEQDGQKYQQSIKDQEAGLRHEWGAAYDKNLGAAKNAAKSLGFDGQKVDALEKALGYDGLMKMMADIGGKIGESEYITGDSGSSGPMTPSQAQAKLTQLRGDSEWVNKYMNGNTEAKAEMERLIKMAYP